MEISHRRRNKRRKKTVRAKIKGSISPYSLSSKQNKQLTLAVGREAHCYCK